MLTFPTLSFSISFIPFLSWMITVSECLVECLRLGGQSTCGKRLGELTLFLELIKLHLTACVGAYHGPLRFFINDTEALNMPYDGGVSFVVWVSRMSSRMANQWLCMPIFIFVSFLRQSSGWYAPSSSYDWIYISFFFKNTPFFQLTHVLFRKSCQSTLKYILPRF